MIYHYMERPLKRANRNFLKSLTPQQIGQAVKLSNVYDGSPVVLNVLANASQDLAGNLMMLNLAFK